MSHIGTFPAPAGDIVGTSAVPSPVIDLSTANPALLALCGRFTAALKEFKTTNNALKYRDDTDRGYIHKHPQWSKHDLWRHGIPEALGDRPALADIERLNGTEIVKAAKSRGDVADAIERGIERLNTYSRLRGGLELARRRSRLYHLQSARDAVRVRIHDIGNEAAALGSTCIADAVLQLEIWQGRLLADGVNVDAYIKGANLNVRSALCMLSGRHGGAA